MVCCCVTAVLEQTQEAGCITQGALVHSGVAAGATRQGGGRRVPADGEGSTVLLAICKIIQKHGSDLSTELNSHSCALWQQVATYVGATTYTGGC